MKWKKIFSKKKEKQSPIHNSDMYALPEEILTAEQILNAFSWYDKHRNHVNELVNGVSKYPPKLNEDKRDCRLWKPEHWNWFLTYYQ